MSSPPSPKRPKLDETQSLPESEYDFSSDDECLKGFRKEDIRDECFKGMSKEEIREYLRYIRQLVESQNFDVDFVPTKLAAIIGNHIFPCNLRDPKEYEEIEKCTQYVINRYNELMKGNSRLRLESIPKANRSQPHYMCNYYITFEAEDTVSARSDTYQTAMCRNFFEDSIWVMFIRKKCDKKEICYPVDLDDQEEFIRLKKCGALAVSEYNEEQDGKSELEFVKVVKALQNMNSNFLIYWITFVAKDTKSDKINTYSAEILYHPDNNCINFDTWPELVEHE